jgi:hypothetical protein
LEKFIEVRGSRRR